MLRDDFFLDCQEAGELCHAMIGQAQIGDMPSFSNTMQMGFNGLKASDAAMKHMIILVN